MSSGDYHIGGPPNCQTTPTCVVRYDMVVFFKGMTINLDYEADLTKHSSS